MIVQLRLKQDRISSHVMEDIYKYADLEQAFRIVRLALEEELVARFNQIIFNSFPIFVNAPIAKSKSSRVSAAFMMVLILALSSATIG